MKNNTHTQYLEPTTESVNATFEKMKLCDTGVFYAYYKDISTGEAVAVPVRLSYDEQGMRIHSDSVSAGGFSKKIGMSEIETMGLTPVRRVLLCPVNSRKE